MGSRKSIAYINILTKSIDLFTTNSSHESILLVAFSAHPLNMIFS